MMNRNELYKKAINHSSFDVIIIGGGATGLGCAVDACSRGLKVLLLEQQDFGKGTSSRSTKLIHGGLRYLQQGNIKLVKEALKERGLLCRNAPHLVSQRKFLVPIYHYLDGPFYGAGLKIYDALAFSYGLDSSKFLTKEEVLQAAPEIKKENLKGGLVYADGQFDDARLLMTLAHTMIDLGGICLNYCKVIDFIKIDGVIQGVVAEDLITHESFHFHSQVVVNATGVFSDELRKRDQKEAENLMAPSQGIHLVLPKAFLSKETAILVPKTEDGRVLFLVPWLDKVLAGTTDTLKEHIELEPKPLEEEIDFILTESAKYLDKAPKREDVLSVFAGLRPLVQQKSKSTKAISRDHVIEISSSNLVTIVGGKWTTYRKMAEDTIDACSKQLKANWTKSKTETLKLHGFLDHPFENQTFLHYGSDREILLAIQKEDLSFSELLHPNLPYLKAEIVFAVRYEMAIHLEDFLARRTRSLLLDAKSTLQIAPEVAKIMAKELGTGCEWIDNELKNFRVLAENYALNSTKSF
jgi:glycerol-3-phosphate dehydrogenase